MILFGWKEWAGDTEPRDYVANLVATEDGLLDFLVGFLSEIRSTTAGSYLERKIPHIRRDAIAHFVDPESLVNRVQSIKANRMNDLTPQQRVAIEAFLNPERELD